MATATNRIDTAFQEYLKKVFPEALPDAQVRELRLCWFAAYATCYDDCVRASSAMTEEKAMERLTETMNELEAFAATFLPKN